MYKGGEQQQHYYDNAYYDDITHNTHTHQDSTISLEKKLRSKMANELYKLDYKDIIGRIPTCFKYRKVEPISYGLSTQEIRFSRDAMIKAFTGLG